VYFENLCGWGCATVWDCAICEPFSFENMYATRLVCLWNLIVFENMNAFLSIRLVCHFRRKKLVTWEHNMSFSLIHWDSWYILIAKYTRFTQSSQLLPNYKLTQVYKQEAHISAASLSP
jgi:hypothetical protein